MKKIMVIGAGIYQNPLIETAAEYGNVILVAPVVTPEQAKLAQRVYPCDVRDQDAILDIARAEQIDAVVTDQTDIAVRTVAYVAENMGLPGIGYETAKLFTDKNLMRRRCEELGLPVLPYRTVGTLAEAEAFLQEIGRPAIIKPVDNQGSRGVQRIENHADLIKKFEEAQTASHSGLVVIEQLASGREFVVEGLTWNHQYRTLICGDTEYFDIPDAYAAKTRIFPTNAPAKLKDLVCARNQAIIEGFGLNHGITHSEFIMDGDEVYLIETAARGGGVFISSDLIPLGSGLRTEHFLIQSALGNPEPEMHLSSGQVCGYMAFFLPDGKVKEINGVDEILSLPYVHRNLLRNIHVGMEIHNATDKTSRFCIIVSADSREQLNQRMEEIKLRLQIICETNDGPKLPIWE